MILIYFLLFIIISSPAFAVTVPNLNSNSSPSKDDLTYTIDVSDTTDSSSGTGKKATIQQIFKAGNITIDGTNVGVNSTSPGTSVDVQGTVRATSFSGDGSALTGVSGSVSDAAYSASWDGDTTTPASKNALYDKIETISTGSGGWTDGGTNVYVSTSTDKVGIGSTTPRSKLDVIGAAYFDDTVTVGGSSILTFSTNGETIKNTNDGYNDFSGGITTGGNIGVNTFSPSAALHVVGGARITGLDCSGNANGGAITASSTGVLSCTDDDSSGAGGTPSGSNQQIQYNNSGAFGGATSFIFDGSNVGIGTTTASTKLTVSGTVTATAFSGPLTGNVTGNSDTATALAVNPSGCSVGDFVSDMDANGTLTCLTPAGGAGGWTDGGTNVFTSTTTDKVGIGTTTPATTLEIVKQSSSSPLMVSSSASGAGDMLIINSAGSVGIGTTNLSASPGLTVMTGNVGIGTWVPSAKLYVKAGTSNQVLAIFRDNGNAAEMNFLCSSTTCTWGTQTSAGHSMGINPNGSRAITFSSAQNTGIGTTLTSSKLTVGGAAAIGLSYAGFTAPTNGMIVQGNVGFGTTAPSNNIDFGTTNDVQWPAQKSTTGTRYLCIDSVGVITSSASACSGT